MFYKGVLEIKYDDFIIEIEDVVVETYDYLGRISFSVQGDIKEIVNNLLENNKFIQYEDLLNKDRQLKKISNYKIKIISFVPYYYYRSRVHEWTMWDTKSYLVKTKTGWFWR